MKEKQKQILLISYVFPPYYGIGGRRWAMHASELADSGYVIHVITANNPFKKVSLWNERVKNNKNIIIHTVESPFPVVLLKQNLTLTEKVLYKCWTWFLSLKIKSNFLDRSILWNKDMLKKAEELIAKNEITKVICTGGPFSAMYSATFLKKKFKNIFLLNDLRDPWTWAPNWGYANLEKKRMAIEQEMESSMIKNSDLVSIPTSAMKAYLDDKYPTEKNKIVLIPHVFDEKDVRPKEKTATKQLRLVFYGAIYEGIETVFENVFSAISQNNNITLTVFSDSVPKIKPLFDKYTCSRILSQPTVEPVKLFSKFNEFDAVLMINPAYNKENISTKFYEIIYSRTPILLISDKGEATDFVTKNKLGKSVTPGEEIEFLTAVKTSEIISDYNNTYDVSQFSLKTVTKRIINLIENSDTKINA